MKRLFIGIPLSNEIQELLSDLYVPSFEIKWIPEDNMHISLLFLGDVDRPTQIEIHQELEKIKMKSFTMSVDGVGHFSDRIFYAKVKPLEEINRLQLKIRNALRNLDITFDTRKFKAHISLARLKNLEENKLIALLKKNAQLKSTDFEVNQFFMYSSELSPKGPTYHQEMSYKLI